MCMYVYTEVVVNSIEINATAWICRPVVFSKSPLQFVLTTFFPILILLFAAITNSCSPLPVIILLCWLLISALERQFPKRD